MKPSAALEAANLLVVREQIRSMLVGVMRDAHSKDYMPVEQYVKTNAELEYIAKMNSQLRLSIAKKLEETYKQWFANFDAYLITLDLDVSDLKAPEMGLATYHLKEEVDTVIF